MTVRGGVLCQRTARDAFLQRQLRRNGGEHAGKRNASNVAFDWLK